MAATFPTSPVDGEYAVVNSITYVYDSANRSWTRVPGGGGGGGGTPGGLNTQVQYNAAGSFAGSAGFTFDSTANAVSVTGNISGANLIQNGTRVIQWTTVANTAPSNAVAGDFWYDSYASKKFQYTNDGTSSFWVDQSAPTTFSSITTNQILNGGSNATGNIGTSATTFNTVFASALSTTQIVNSGSNGVGNIGSSSSYFNTVFAKATSAQYADLAEKYTSDADYDPGTVVVFGGEAEITISTVECDSKVAGVISTDPAFIMNSTSDGLLVALTGRVPCMVKGPVTKGDVLTTSDIPGVAQRLESNWKPGCVIGKSLEPVESGLVKIIEVVVGRF